ncbi:conserved protein of unknown function [Rhodovastum atsumiense]|uniref:Uncharacterized protein n=1 Tax=Rhodovastum atsumiense TaxID=504468 RepID=A0A5M6IYA3_9PROT|nr:hypothetical protein [Rhodovastum atsumiense]KAA5613261.1 hypothetical protein F1189_06110 [Rhodovastum atsumiense]CAH2600577.1 conserved protein of unknown function [Rhodovastum atsumiense]
MQHQLLELSGTELDLVGAGHGSYGFNEHWHASRRWRHHGHRHNWGHKKDASKPVSTPTSTNTATVNVEVNVSINQS